MNWESVRSPIVGWVACAILSCFSNPAAFCQGKATNPLSGSTPGAMPLVNVGGGPMDAQFESMHFAQKILAQQNRNPSQNQKERERQQALVDSGALSAFDLAAPPKRLTNSIRRPPYCGAHVPRKSSSISKKRLPCIPSSSLPTITSAWLISAPTTRQKRKPSSKPPRISTKSSPGRF